MKKQKLENTLKRIVKLVIILFFILPLSGLTSCDDNDGKPELPDSNQLLQEVKPILSPQNNDFKDLDKYGVSLYLFNDMSSECYKYQYADNFSKLSSFVVERAAYSLTALMISPESTNVAYEASKNAVKNDDIVIRNMNNDIPDIVIGTTEIKQAVTEPVNITDLTRVVAGINITINNVPQDVTAIDVIVGDIYDKVSFSGEYSFSTGSSVSKRIMLEKNGTTFSKQSVILPSDESKDKVGISFRVYKNSDIEDFVYTISGKIIANKITNISENALDIFKNAQISLDVSYSAWSESQIIIDDIIIKDDLNKNWTSAPLPIGGNSGAKHDNFWASSSLIDDWSQCHDSYLYDGIKDEEHQNEYWAPAYAPAYWFIDLKERKEGIEITYWNKFGGKGGQKVRTMDIYGSNNRNDYEGGDSDWELISTFTSDKTKPTVDAGAEVTTGRIMFNEGDSSYRYIRCHFTSKVSHDGVVSDDTDVNVSEVEVIVWTCK